METWIDLGQHRAGVGDTVIELEDHQIGQLRAVAGDDFGPKEQESALEDVVERIRAFLRDCGRPISRTSIQHEAKEAFGVHLYLLATEQQGPEE